MVKRKNSGVSLFTVLTLGLSSCYAVSATGNGASLVESEKRTKNKKDGNVPIRADGADDKKGSVNATNLVGYGVGAVGLATGTAAAVDKINRSGSATDINDRIKQLEDTINKLTEIAGQKMSELYQGTKTPESSANAFATVMYILVSLVMISLLACVLLLL